MMAAEVWKDWWREQAEASLAAGFKTDPFPHASDNARLLHELQVQQVELHMQMQALREALHDAENYKAKYLDLYDTAPVAYLAVRRNGTISKLNRRAIAMLGRSSAADHDLLGQPIADFMSPDSVDKVQALLGQAFEGDGEFHTQELVLSGPVLPVYASARARAYTPPGSPERQACLALIDVTALRMATDDVIQHMMQFDD